MTIDIRTLFQSATVQAIYKAGIELLASLGVDTSTFRDGDPTLTTTYFLAEELAQRDLVAEQFIKSGFLSTAEGDWKALNASEVYGVDAEPATYATSSVSVQNNGGGYYPLEARDVTFKSSTSNKTYHSTNAVTLAAGEIKTFEVEADEPGSGSSAAANEIDQIVSPAMQDVVVLSSTAAIGVDEQSDASLEQACDDSLGALSPDGPADAYRFVARNSKLTGVTEVTRAESVSVAAYGLVDVWLAGLAGAVAGATVIAVQAAIDRWATPLCVTATAKSAVNHAINLDCQIYGRNMPGDAVSVATIAFNGLFPSLSISQHNASVADGQTVVTQEVIRSAIHAALTEAGASGVGITLTTPAADVRLLIGEVAVPGTIAIAETSP